MAVVQGIREKVHLPVYDSLSIAPGKQLREEESTSVIKFFVDVQRKTKLETNLQSASLLPHYNTFEARAMRVVISDLPPAFSDEKDVEILGIRANQASATAEGSEAKSSRKRARKSSVTTDTEVTLLTDLSRAMELLAEARETEDGTVIVFAAENGDVFEEVEEDGEEIVLEVLAIEAGIEELERDAPPREQLRPDNGAGNLINKLIFNTVTTLYVGEKIMIQMPTWFFPGGAGAFSEGSKFISHGEPSPLATFRFAEPIFIDKQQNFRVEIEVPDKDVLDDIQKIYGPFNIWVVLDGYMMRDVQ